MFSPRPQFCTRDNIRLAFKRDCYKTKHYYGRFSADELSSHVRARRRHIAFSVESDRKFIKDRIPIVGLPKINDHYTQRADFRYG